MGQVKVDHHMQAVRPANDATRIFETRQRAEEQASTSQHQTGRIDAYSLADLLDARKSCTSPSDLRQLAEKYRMDPGVVEELSRNVNNMKFPVSPVLAIAFSPLLRASPLTSAPAGTTTGPSAPSETDSCFTQIFAVPAPSPSSTGPYVPLWGICGGIAHTEGPTECVPGAVCTVLNDFWFQCLPGPATSTTAPVSTQIICS
ncbi:hypothetical protein EYR40_001064 [Pleurotus pulmonarius]|nr:hypothetical protein EYR40_001064 [Pleurotus pulmonarius]